MKHTVEIHSQHGIEKSFEGLTKKQAVEMAKKLIYNDGKYYNYEVFISALRKSDGQYLHLNRSGYEPVGKSWN